MNEVAVRPANALDDKIIQYAGSHSPEEISFMLGGMVSPERIMSRTHELLKTRGWLTIAQSQQRLHLVLNQLLAKMQDKYLDIDNAKVMLAMVKELFSQTERMGRATDDDLNKLYSNQGILMVRVVDKAMGYMRGALRDKVPAELWDELLAEALEAARDEIAKFMDDDADPLPERAEIEAK